MTRNKGYLQMLLMAYLVARSTQQGSSCQCSLFKRNYNWAPEELVFTMSISRYLNCSDSSASNERCKKWCEGEVIAMKALVNKDPTLLQNHQPSSLLHCNSAEENTIAFARICNSQTYTVASNLFGPSVCCDPVTNSPTWCLSTQEDQADDWSFQHMGIGNELQSRRLDLRKDQNDASMNEIEDTGRPEKSDIVQSPTKKEPSVSWVKAALKFFGYSSFGDLIRNVDIFAIPGKIKSAVKTYKDELSMGRCYMEFTTFKVFTKQENPFEDLLRRKREIQMEDLAEDATEAEYPEARGLDPIKKEARKRAVENFIGAIRNWLGKSEETRQYASLLNTFLPVVSQMYTGESSSVVPTLLNFVGPLLKQMQFSRPSSKPSEKVDTVASYTPPKPVASQASSPLTSMAVGVVGNLIRNFLSSPPAPVNKVSEIPVVSLQTERPAPSVPTLGDLSAPGIGTLVNLLLQGLVKSPAPIRRPAQAPPTPTPVVKNTAEKDSSLNEKKGFIGMLLEVIRPIFISIMGATPGDSGVKDIRRVSTLSTLGRVDDTLREEVDSPLFCFKKYAVNKAWSITESGIRSVVDTFSIEEQERMMRMLKS